MSTIALASCSCTPVIYIQLWVCINACVLRDSLKEMEAYMWMLGDGERPMRKKGNRWPLSHLNACCGRLGQGHSNNHRFELKLSSAVAKPSGSPLVRQALVTVPSSEEKRAVIGGTLQSMPKNMNMSTFIYLSQYKQCNLIAQGYCQRFWCLNQE